MSRILENLRDPSWWFTVVAVATVVSVLAGFAKDYTGRAAALLSGRLQEWRARRAAEEKRIAAQIAEDPTSVLIRLILVVLVVLLFAFSSILFWLNMVLWQALHALHWMGYLLGVMSVVTGFWAASALNSTRAIVAAYVDSVRQRRREKP